MQLYSLACPCLNRLQTALSIYLFLFKNNEKILRDIYLFEKKNLFNMKMVINVQLIASECLLFTGDFISFSSREDYTESFSRESTSTSCQIISRTVLCTLS